MPSQSYAYLKFYDDQECEEGLQKILGFSNPTPKEKLINELAFAKKSLASLTDDLDKKIVSREDNYTACVTYFLLASSSLWLGGGAYCFFQYESSSHGIHDLGVNIIAAKIFGALFTGGDWINDTFGISPTNDADKLAFSNTENGPSSISGKLFQLLSYIINNPLKFALLDIPCFICYFTGSSASFSSILPYLLWLSGNPGFGTPLYYSVIAFDFLITIMPGMVYYYCFNSRPFEKTKEAWELFMRKRWSECDINVYRICEAVSDSVAVMLYRSIWLAGISTIFLEALEVPLTSPQKLSATIIVFFCSMINVVLTRCLKTAAPYFDYVFVALSKEKKQAALNRLSYYDIYWNLNILSGITTSTGIALLTYLCISNDKNIALSLAVLFGLLKLFISIMAQRDLAACQKALPKIVKPDIQKISENRLEIAKKSFSALANTFKEETWLLWLVTISTLLGRGAKLSGFEHFNVLLSKLANIELSFIAMIAMLLIVIIANARNEFRTFYDIMIDILTQKIAEAYVQHHAAIVDSVQTPLLTDSECTEESADRPPAQTKTFNSMCVLFPWNLSVYCKGMIDTTPNKLAQAVNARTYEISS